jgi:hypothetical protein
VGILRAGEWIVLYLQFGNLDWVGDKGANDGAGCRSNKNVVFLSIFFLMAHRIIKQSIPKLILFFKSNIHQQKMLKVSSQQCS